jgi:hypothetical protein
MLSSVGDADVLNARAILANAAFASVCGYVLGRCYEA